MQQAEFIHLVRTSEQAAQADARRYRWVVTAWALLGLAVIALMAGAAVVLLALAAAGLRADGFRLWHLGAGVSGAALLWVSLSALFCGLERPKGVRIEPQEAPELFEALKRMREAVKGPAIDEVLIDEDFNAAIVQRPRLGLLGLAGHTNTLILGWPLMCALEPKRLWAVVAHEYGHLRGEHGRFSAWVYRTRAAWWRVHRGVQQDSGPVAALLRAFFAWYLPHFDARTFALARQDEYEADRIAVQLCGRETVAQAWLEIEIKSRWYREAYWPDLWRRAATQETPDPLPFAAMRRKVRRGPPEAFAREALRRTLKQLPHHEDTHPVARDRLAAIGASAQVPTWSRHSSVRLLGLSAKRVAAQFDQAWWSRSRNDWARHRELLQRCLARVQALKARAHTLSAAEFIDWADCFEALSSNDSSLLYEHALRLDPQHPRALRRLGELRAQVLHPQALDTLERLQASHPQHGQSACAIALDLLERLQHAGQDVPDALRRTWRERSEQFEQAEARAWSAFTSADPCSHCTPPTWTDAERRTVTEALIGTPMVKAAWVAGRSLAEMPQRAYLVLFVELQHQDDTLAQETVAHLMRDLDGFAPRLRVVAVPGEASPADVERSGATSVYRRQGR